MHGQGGLRWLLFALYVFLFITLPFTILFGKLGLILSSLVFLGFMFALRYRGMEKIMLRLHAIPLSEANAPVLCHIIEEHCRRKGVNQIPRLCLIPSESLNSATLGFSGADCAIVITEGLWNQLSRDELSQVLAVQVDLIQRRHYVCQTWLSQFLGLLDPFIISRPSALEHGRRTTYPFRLVMRQAILLPLILFPFLMLRGRKQSAKLPPVAPKLSLIEAVSKMEASAVRVPLHVPFSVRHLFLLTPRSREPIVRVLFREEDSKDSFRNRLTLSSIRAQHAN